MEVVVVEEAAVPRPVVVVVLVEVAAEVLHPEVAGAVEAVEAAGVQG